MDIFLKEFFGDFYPLVNAAVWIVGAVALSCLLFGGIRLVARIARVDLFEVFKGMLDEKSTKQPFKLSMLGIEIVARSKFGKMVFVVVLPSMIGSIAALAANWMSHTPQIP